MKNILEEEAAIHIQKLFRCRAARKCMLQVAMSVYRKCYDASTGMNYYCNIKTGETGWERPKVFGILNDAPTFEGPPASESNHQQTDASFRPEEAMPIDNSSFPSDTNCDAGLGSQDTDDCREIKKNIELQDKCRTHAEGHSMVKRQAQAKSDLERNHRKKVVQGRKNWEKRVLQSRQEAKQARLLAIHSANKQRIQELYDGKVLVSI